MVGTEIMGGLCLRFHRPTICYGAQHILGVLGILESSLILFYTSIVVDKLFAVLFLEDIHS
jgi:hypothetical protein